MIKYNVFEGVAHITLNRPEKRNALNRELIVGLQDAFASAAADPWVRAILLRGAAPDFCAGLDLKAMPQDADVAAHLAHAQSLADVYLMMRRNPKPIVTAVEGRAIGGGAGLATASDLLLMHENAELRYPEVNLGFVAAIVMAMLRRQVSENRAFEILALAEPIPAARAVEWGIANATFRTDSDIDSYTARLTEKSLSAISLTKSLLHHIDAMPFEAAMQAGVYTNALARFTPDFMKKPQGKS